MQLFTKQESNKAFKEKQAQDLVEIGYLKTTLKRLQDQINRANTDFEQQMDNQRKVYAEAKEKLQNDVLSLKKEISDLHEERSRALIPVTSLKEEAEKMLADLKERKAKIVEKEEELDEQLALVHSKIDDLSTREGIIREGEDKLALKRKGIEEESAKISASHTKLNNEISQFNTRVVTKETQIAKREKALEIKEKSLISNKEKQDQLFANEWKRIKDEREVLERGFAELQKLKDKYNDKQNLRNTISSND